MCAMVMSSLTDDACYRTVLSPLRGMTAASNLHPGSNQLPGHARSQE
jgi:hypothetical protein